MKHLLTQRRYRGYHFSYVSYYPNHEVPGLVLRPCHLPLAILPSRASLVYVRISQ